MDENMTPIENKACEAANGKSGSKSKKRRRRFGDRKDGRRVRGIHPMQYMIPFLMSERSDAQNHFEDELDITNIEKYIQEKREAGYSDMGFLHVFIAAYVRAVSQRPAINRFLSGQHVYARPDVVAVMPVKKQMSIESPDTTIKVHFDQRDTAVTVYEKFEAVYRAAISSENNFDKLASRLMKIPSLFLRFTVSFLKFLDYFGWLPKSLLEVSPFHGSVIITSMGSLGINAIYHHLYNFGNLPVFLSYGKKYTKTVFNDDGVAEKRRFVTFRAVVDERICDGYYYASGFKIMKRYLLHPELLDTEMTEFVEDID
ncbi:MAG: hypothetical protein J6V07_06830 [Clostridia bacterium]|nr:hypothetical protein [Clostridia bacterium]